MFYPSPTKYLGLVKYPELYHFEAGDLANEIKTSYVERGNLQIRMQNRKSTRLIKGHSKEFESYIADLGLYFIFYNFCRQNLAHKGKGNKTHRTPSTIAGLTNDVWTIEEMINIVIS